MKHCKMCGAWLNEPVLTLPNMPASAQGFVSKKIKTSQTLKLFECKRCGLVQLSCKPVNYYKEVIRATSVSKEMRALRLKQFKQFFKTYPCKKTIEIGSGSGDYLTILTQVNRNSFGLEASQKNVKVCTEQGLHVFKGYLDNENKKIPQAPYDSFIMMNFLEHFPQPLKALKAIYNNLTPQAYGLVEVPNYDRTLEQGLYTDFIPDHLLYFTKETLALMLHLAGFEVIKMRTVFHQSILQAEVKKRKAHSYATFAGEIAKDKKQMQALLKRFAPGELAIWGAGHQALALMSVAGLNAQKIKYVVDSAPFKQNKLTPATFIPIVSPSVLFTPPPLENGVCIKPKAILVIAGGYTDEIVGQIKQSGVKIKVFVLSGGVIYEK